MLYTEKLAKELKQGLDNIEIKVEEDKDRSFDVIATTEDTDRDNEIVKVNGRDTKNWEKNPVVLANHSYTIENIIGKGTRFYTSNGVKRLKGVFSKTNPLGVLAKDLYNEGMLKTVSVGFIPTQRNTQDYKIIEKAELLEVSFVAVPANPNAISLDEKTYEKAVKYGFIKEEGGEETKGDETKEETTELEELKKDIAEIKLMIKSLADDKVNQDQIAKQEKEAKEKKELLQAINKATATALENIKKL